MLDPTYPLNSHAAKYSLLLKAEVEASPKSPPKSPFVPVLDQIGGVAGGVVDFETWVARRKPVEAVEAGLGSGRRVGVGQVPASAKKNVIDKGTGAGVVKNKKASVPAKERKATTAETMTPKKAAAHTKIKMATTTITSPAASTRPARVRKAVERYIDDSASATATASPAVTSVVKKPVAKNAAALIVVKKASATKEEEEEKKKKKKKKTTKVGGSSAGGVKKNTKGAASSSLTTTTTATTAAQESHRKEMMEELVGKYLNGEEGEKTETKKIGKSAKEKVERNVDEKKDGEKEKEDSPVKVKPKGKAKAKKGKANKDSDPDR